MQDSILNGVLPADTAAVRADAPLGQRPAAESAPGFDDHVLDWNTLLRDITAIANSGGGQLTVDVEVNETELHRRFPASDSVELAVDKRDSASGTITVIHVGSALFPIEHNGEFYFRHGETSEPATSADVRASFERLLRRARHRWLRGIKRVLDAPIDSLVGKKGKRRELTVHSAANLQPVRIVTDPNAPALHPTDVDHLYPWRQKDLIQELNGRLGRRFLNSYDIQAVRRYHRLDERPDFVFNLPGAGRRYSPAVAEWIMEECARDPEFFHKARVADQEMLRLRRQKPK
jgi:hypothetical protein